MDTIVNNFKKMINISILLLVLELVIGIFFIFSASFALSVSAVLVGSLLLVEGIFSLIRYLYDGLANRVFAVDLIFSVSSIILGLFSIFNTLEVVTIVGIIFGIWMLVHGCCKLYYAISLKEYDTDLFIILLSISIFFLLMGIVVLFNPFETFMLVTKLIGYFMVASSILDTVYYLLFKKQAILFLKRFE